MKNVPGIDPFFNIIWFWKWNKKCFLKFNNSWMEKNIIQCRPPFVSLNLLLPCFCSPLPFQFLLPLDLPFLYQIPMFFQLYPLPALNIMTKKCCHDAISFI